MVSVRSVFLACIAFLAVGVGAPALAADTADTSDNTGAASGNQAEAPVERRSSIECNAAGILGSADAECAESVPSPKPKPSSKPPVVSAPPVTSSAVPSTSEAEEDLPVTGSNVGIILLVGAGVLFAGVVAVRLAAKRARS